MPILQKPIVRDATAEQAPYRGLAFTQMGILKAYMKTAGINVYSRTVRLANGVIVTCKVCFNREDINICVPPIVSERVEEPLTEIPLGGFLLHNNIPLTRGYPHLWNDEEWFLQRMAAPVSAEEFKKLRASDVQWRGWRGAKPTELLAGNVDWQGYSGTLSWDGPPSRYWGAESAQYTNIFYPNDVPYFGDYLEWSPPPGTFRLLVGQVHEWGGRRLIFRGGKAITEYQPYMITSATLSPDGKRCMVTVSAEARAEKVYFFTLSSAPVGLTDWRLSATFANFDLASEFSGLDADDIAQNVAPYGTLIWRFNASGTIGITERYGRRQTMTVDWENETVAVEAGVSSQVDSYDRAGTILKEVTGPFENDDPEFPDYYIINTQQLETSYDRTRTFRFCDWQGDTLVEGLLTLHTEVVTGWDTATGWGRPESLQETETVTMTINGISVLTEAQTQTTAFDATNFNNYTTTRTAAFQLYLHGLDLRSNSWAIDKLTFASWSGSNEDELSIERPVTCTALTTVAGVDQGYSGSGVLFDTLTVDIPTAPIFTNTGETPGTGGGAYTFSESFVARLSRDGKFAPHNGQGIGGGHLTSRFEFSRSGIRMTQVLAEIQKFPGLKTFTYSTGEMVRFAYNVPKELSPEVLVPSVFYEGTDVIKEIIPETKNWGQIAVI